MLFRNVALISLALVAAASAADTGPTSDHVSSLLSQRRLGRSLQEPYDCSTLTDEKEIEKCEKDAVKFGEKKAKEQLKLEEEAAKAAKKAAEEQAKAAEKNGAPLDTSSLQINQFTGINTLGYGSFQLNGQVGDGTNVSGRPTGVTLIEPNRESEDGAEGADEGAGVGVGVGAGEASSQAPAECDLGTVVDVALDMPNFSSLVAALQAANFVEILKGDGPFTIFAPTNAAFDALGADTVKALFEEDGVPTLSNILLYHVVSGKVMSAELSDGQMVPTVEEANIGISIDEDGVVMVNGATVTTADIPACNGVIHVIDSVLTPPADGADGAAGENNEASGTTDGGDDGDDGDDDGDSGDSGDGSLTGCAGNVLSLLAKGESPIDTPKRCLMDCDCQDGCCVLSGWGGFCTPQSAADPNKSQFGGGYLYCTSATSPNQ